MKSYPHVIIFGQAFNDFSGGGITLANLFKEWPKDGLAVVSYPFMLHNSTTDICKNYYQIGQEELTWRFPFSLVKQKFPSGKLESRAEGRVPVLSENKKIRHSISSNILTPVMKWSGLVHSVSSIHLSQKLKAWLADFEPEILYLQISNRESIIFARELIDFLKIPAVLHMMDDWPSTISARGPLMNYWNKRIDSDFRLLLDKTDIHLSISDAMSDEYFRRYGKTFRAFHNPIDPKLFNAELPPAKDKNNRFRILYIGRIGTANKKSLLRFASFISKFRYGEVILEFDIYTKDYDSSIARRVGKLDRVSLKGAIDHKEIPALMQTYDLLVLPLDFTDYALKFSRFSMPTKASEYMMSGTPMLVFAPSETALSKFCVENDCGYCVSSNNSKELAKSIMILSQDYAIRRKLGLNARRLAAQLFDACTVRQRFEELFSTAHKS